MNNLKANLWLFRKKTKDITFSYEIKQKARFVKGSIIAIICGLIIGGIIIAAQDVNPFIYLKYLFHIGFNGLFVNQTIQWLCIYIIAGLAVGIGFKSGMFNIGVSGQMVMGSGIAIIFFKLGVEPHLAAGHTMNAGYIIVMFLICAFSGAIWSGIAGALKALFNIHEVVTTIMLSWTAWYLMKYLFTKFSTTIGGHGIASSGSIPGSSLTIHGSTIAIPIIIAVIAVIAIAVILSKTVFGYKLKAVGASPSASKYAGFSVKRKMVDAMLISGLLAGIAGFVNIFTITPNITFAVDNLPQIGYDSIAITLVAFNNPIGIVGSSFLWAVLQSAGSSTASLFNLPTQMSQLIFGVIVYFAAISVVFINWYPIIKLRIMIALTSSKASQIKIKNLRKQQLQYRKELLNINSSEDIRNYKQFVKEQIAEQNKLFKESSQTKQDKADYDKQVRQLKDDMNIYVKEYRKNLKEMISKINHQIKSIKKNNYVSRINSAREGIDRREFDAIRELEQDALSKTSLIKSNMLSLKDNYKKDLKEKKNWLSTQLRALKKEYKLKLTQNAVWFESETGIKNHFWDMKNGKIEAKALINKCKIDTHNKILGIKSDHQMAKLDAKSKNKNNPEKLKQIDEKLLVQMNERIAQAKEQERQFIQGQHEHIAQLVDIYKTTKAANEEDQRRILADKAAVEIKKKEITEILDVWDNNLATLVDIKLARELKDEQVGLWYWKEVKKLYDQDRELIKQTDWNTSYKTYKKVEKAVDEYKADSKALGTEADFKTIKAKKKLLDKLVRKVNKIWPEEFSWIDNNHWTKVRYKTYIYIDKQQAELSKIGIAVNAHNNIKNIERKARFIRKMYNKNIKAFKDQYVMNKRVNVAQAQFNYHKQVEAFISKLENSSFKKLREIAAKEVM